MKNEVCEGRYENGKRIIHACDMPNSLTMKPLCGFSQPNVIIEPMSRKMPAGPLEL